MPIQPKTLKSLRERVPMSQQGLAEVSRVSKKTIARTETGRSTPNAKTIERLAKALGVSTEALSKEPYEERDTESGLRESGYQLWKIWIDGETVLAFQLVERLYGIPIRSQILMAPLFAALLAEGSFAWRRQRLAEIETSTDNLFSVAEGHLSFAGSLGNVTEGAFRERKSIDTRDVFGRQLVDDLVNDGFDPHERNPFADYLQAFAAQSGASEIEFDPEGIGEWKTEEGLPEYRIATAFVERLSGGDRWAEFALLHGHARISDIPEEYTGEDATPDRIAWLASKIPAEVRAREEDYLAKFGAIDLKL